MTRHRLYVVVQVLGPSEFSWELMKKQCTSSLAECVAASSMHFTDYDGALDAGFVALQELSASVQLGDDAASCGNRQPVGTTGSGCMLHS